MMNSNGTKLAIAAVSIAVYFMAGAYLKYTYVPAHPPADGAIQLKWPFERSYGSRLAFVARMPELEALSDNNDEPRRSKFVVYENDHPLGPPHSEHADISKLGNGRFSHWTQEGFIFSTSDNTSPQNTGRKYWIVRPPRE
jgi:hypothetical protein